MPEENDKKISYKIITAEHLIEEKEAGSKEAKISNESSVEPEVVKKAEPLPSFQPTEENKVTKVIPETMKIEAESESGVVHSPIEETTIPSISFVEQPPQSTPQNLIDQTTTLELKTFKPEPFTSQQPEKPVSEIKPKFEIIKDESLISVEPDKQLVQEKDFKKVNFKLIAIIFGGIIVLFFGVAFLKPQEKLKLIFSKKKEEKTTTTTPVSENLALRLPQIITTSEPIINIVSTITTDHVSTTTDQKLLEATSSKDTISTTTNLTTTVVFEKSTTNLTIATKTFTSTIFETTSKKLLATKTSTKTEKISTSTKTEMTSITKPTTTATSQSIKNITTSEVLAVPATSTKTATTIATNTSKTATLTATTLPSKSTTATNTSKTATLTATTLPSKSTTATTSIITPTTSEATEIIMFPGILETRIDLKEPTLSEFEKELNSFLNYQGPYGSLTSLKIMVNDNPAPMDLIFFYFIKPSKMKPDEVKNFKENLNNKFALIIFYGYTRKYPILILEVKNPKLAKDFNIQWMKNDMIKDLKNLFLSEDPGEIISKFTLKKIDNFSYNIIYFQNNFQLVWLLANNYLIYSVNELGLRQVIDYLKK
jgi:hypothetical protein